MENIFQYLTLEDVSNPKCSIQDLQRISPAFDENNYMTYFIFLQCRPDINGEERVYYEQIMNDLKVQEEHRIHEMLSKFENNM